LINLQQSSWNALNGLIFHDFVPCNIKKFLGSSFLGYPFEISKKIYINIFFTYNQKGGPFYTSKDAYLFLGPFWGQKW